MKHKKKLIWPNKTITYPINYFIAAGLAICPNNQMKFYVSFTQYPPFMKKKQQDKEQTLAKPSVENAKIEANSTKNNDGGYIWLV